MFEGKALNVLQKYPSISTFAKIGGNSDTNRYLAELQQKAKLTLVSATSIIEGGAHDVIQKETSLGTIK